MIRKQYGVSLVEMMVSVSLVAIVFTITVGLFMQAGKVFSRTSVRIEPQRSLTLAIKKMEGDMREAMFVRIGSNSTMVELGMPLLDENGMIAMSNITLSGDGERTTIGRKEGKHLCYFLGRDSRFFKSIAIPDAVYGDSIYLISSGSDTSVGSDIINEEGGLALYYTNAKKIISGVRPNSVVTDPISGLEVIGPIFSYVGNTESNLYDSVALDSQLIRISLTVPVQVIEGSTQTLRNHTLASEFCLRNFETLN